MKQLHKVIHQFSRTLVNRLFLTSLVLLFSNISFAVGDFSHCSQHVKSLLFDQLSDNEGYLSLNNMDIHDGCGLDVVRYLNKSHKPLIKLSLRNNRLSGEFAKALGELLSTDFVKLTTLDLSFNQFDPKSVQSLFNVISKSSKLHSLSFEGNQLGILRQDDFIGAMEKLSKLSHINLARNNIDSKLMQSLSDSLYQFNHLVSLDLSYNSISDSGLIALISIISKSDTISNLDIQFVKSGTPAAEALLAWLHELDHSIRVNFSYNYYSNHLMSEFKALSESGVDIQL